MTRDGPSTDHVWDSDDDDDSGPTRVEGLWDTHRHTCRERATSTDTAPFGLSRSPAKRRRDPTPSAWTPANHLGPPRAPPTPDLEPPDGRGEVGRVTVAGRDGREPVTPARVPPTLLPTVQPPRPCARPTFYPHPHETGKPWYLFMSFLTSGLTRGTHHPTPLYRETGEDGEVESPLSLQAGGTDIGLST